MTEIIKFSVDDVRFPTSKDLTGSDAVHTDPDYSATYVTVVTSDKNLKGYGIAFTIGKGNDIVADCIKHFFPMFEGMKIEELENNIGNLWYKCVDHSQLRWLGPEKGVVHMAVAAIFNSFWDLIAKKHNKPLWRFIVDSEPETIMKWLTFKNIEDALSRDEAYAILSESQKHKDERIKRILEEGYPSYTTAAGWLGYSDEKIVKLCKKYIAMGWKHFKVKVGLDLDADVKDYSYTFMHCTANWKKSDLMKSEYLDAIYKKRITEYEFSFNTIQDYTHYHVNFPEEDLKPLISGNYILKVFLQGKLIITKRFMVLEKKLNIDAEIRKATLVNDRKIKHEVDFTINHPELRIIDPFSEIKVIVRQNNREDNSIIDLQPLFYYLTNPNQDIEDRLLGISHIKFCQFSIETPSINVQRLAALNN